jgi:hypothetical protein
MHKTSKNSAATGRFKEKGTPAMAEIERWPKATGNLSQLIFVARQDMSLPE